MILGKDGQGGGSVTARRLYAVVTRRQVQEKSMAKQATETSEAPEKENDAPDGPLLDLSDAAVRKMIKNAKRRGYVTYEQLNEVMPSEEVTSEQIEDTLAMLNDMGINVVEGRGSRRGRGRRGRRDRRGAGRARKRRTGGGRPARCRPLRNQVRARRAHGRSSAHVSARDGQRRTALTRGAKSPSPSASRPAARR